ncbi:hypothetical protein BDV19DRAFT_387518 [Aspergillus venezuelensis]
MENNGHYDTFTDGTDYDMYEDSNDTVAYAIQLAMKDNEDWLVEKALERIRRAHAEGHKNVTFTQRELEALERRRLQEAPESTVSSHQMQRSGPAPPSPQDTSVYETWARTTSASVSPQSSTTTLRSPLQPPYPGSTSRAPAFLAPPTVSHSHPEHHQRIPPHQALHSQRPVDPQRGSTRPGQRPYSNVPFPSHASLVPSDLAIMAPGSLGNKDSESDRSSFLKRSPASSGDELPMVEVIEHKVPSSPTRTVGRGSRQRITRP